MVLNSRQFLSKFQKSPCPKRKRITATTFPFLEPLPLRVSRSIIKKKRPNSFTGEAESEDSDSGDKGQSKALHQDYEGCNEVKGCFGPSTNCITSGTCSMMVTYSLDSNAKQYKFTLHSTEVDAGNYIALGLSQDAAMGEDLVVFCSTEVGSPIEFSWNDGKSNVKAGLEGVTAVNSEATKQIDGVSSKFADNA